MNTPLVSVIIPTFNRAHFIERAITSVCNQTYKNLEIIVVDDHSKDNTGDKVKAIKDKRIVYIRHSENKGGAAARNSGINASQGEYIAFLDSDDEWLPGKIEKQLSIFQGGTERLGAVGAGGKLVKDFEGKGDNVVIKSRIPLGTFGNIYKKLLSGSAFPGRANWPGSTSNIMIRRECFKKVGVFDERLKAAQEHDLYIRISKYYDFDAVKEPLVIMNVHEGDRISTSSGDQIEGRRQFLDKHREEFPVFSLLKARFNFHIGLNLLKPGSINDGRRFLFKSLLSYPFIFKYWAIFAASLTPFYDYLIFKRKGLRKKRI